MTKIDIFSGFLGAGKTTLIKKLLKEALAGTKVVLIENEFGEIGVDGGFLKEAGIQIKEMNSGCICCSLVGDFGASLKEVLDTYEPDRILIEPSGVGKLSDVIKAVQKVDSGKEVVLNSAVAVVDAKKCKMYLKNFGEFFVNQIEAAGTIILSRSQDMTEEKLLEVVAMIKEHNDHATIITTPWDDLKGEDILATIESKNQMEEDLLHEVEEHHHHHHDDDDDDDEECCCHHHHDDDDDDDDEHEHHHHHHHDDDDDDDDEHEHHHHHHHHDDDDDDDDEECCCHHDHDHDHEHHHHHHHHGHDADEVFTSWGLETPAKYSKEDIEHILGELDRSVYGLVLRAKGMVPSENGEWIYFDYVPEESDVRVGAPQVTGKFCVIGSKLNEDKLEELFAK
ncbi:MAG: GTP-binding protein [Lachnospiraceae bacterium]|nr:GTP-binding protein [Lachnospiraceae bacterium]